MLHCYVNIKYISNIHKSKTIWYVNINIYNFWKIFYYFGIIINEEFSYFFFIKTYKTNIFMKYIINANSYFSKIMNVTVNILTVFNLLIIIEIKIIQLKLLWIKVISFEIFLLINEFINSK